MSSSLQALLEKAKAPRPSKSLDVKLTVREREILQFVTAYIAGCGSSPSIREIGGHVGLSSSSTVHMHLKKLQAKGYLLGTPSGPRQWRLVRRVDQAEVVALLERWLQDSSCPKLVEDTQHLLGLMRGGA